MIDQFYIYLLSLDEISRSLALWIITFIFDALLLAMLLPLFLNLLEERKWSRIRQRLAESTYEWFKAAIFTFNESVETDGRDAANAKSQLRVPELLRLLNVAMTPTFSKQLAHLIEYKRWMRRRHLDICESFDQLEHSAEVLGYVPDTYLKSIAFRLEQIIPSFPTLTAFQLLEKVDINVIMRSTDLLDAHHQYVRTAVARVRLLLEKTPAKHDSLKGMVTDPAELEGLQALESIFEHNEDFRKKLTGAGATWFAYREEPWKRWLTPVIRRRARKWFGLNEDSPHYRWLVDRDDRRDRGSP